MKKFKIGITTLIIVSLMLGLGGLSTAAYYRTKFLLTNNLEQALVSIASASSAQIGEWLAARQGEVELITRRAMFKSGDKNTIMTYLDQETRDNPIYEQFFVSDTKGNYYLNTGQTGSVADRDYFRQVMNTGQTVISDPIISRGSGNQIIVVAAPIRNGDKLIGLIGGSVNLTKMSHEMSSVKVGDAGYAILLQQDGLVIAHPDPTVMMKYNFLTDQSSNPETLGFIHKMIQMQTGVAKYSVQGEDQLMAFAPVSHVRWSLGVVVPATYITNQLNYMPVFFGGITLFVGVLLSLLLRRWLVEPLSNLTNITTFLAREPLNSKDVQLINSPIQEISSLTKNFSDMEIALCHTFQSMKESNQALRLSERRFAKAFYSSPQAKCIIKLSDVSFIDVNEQFTALMGLTKKEMIGQTPSELGVQPAETERFYQILQENGSIRNLEVTIAARDGRIRTALLSVEQIEIDGELCGMCDFSDITDLKVMQRELVRLERLNLVGQMAAGIGHEIRNPLTTVHGFLQLLGNKPQFAEEKSIFDLMISELARANSIITEFLSLARTRKTELYLQSLNDILNQLFPLVEADTLTQNKRIKLFLKDIPVLELNKKEISQLVLNLARNGLEAMDERGCLIIQTYQEEDKAVLLIEDEGCGISEEGLSKLGTPFYTTKDSGTGLGLATSFKIAESHNAKIDVISNSLGTKFYIRFPVPDKMLS